MSYVYLKTKANSESLTTNVIPLKVTSIGISVDKTIPSMPVPISGLTFGEATVAALDAGMSRKSLSIQGFILPDTITKDGGGGHDTIFDAGKAALNYTAHEIAQMIASGVDSTGAAIHQAFDELVFLIPSTVDENFVQVTERNIPWTFASRGGANELDNYRVPFPNDFPTSETSSGVKGFIRQFGCDFTSDTVEVSFNMTFEVATIFP